MINFPNQIEAELRLKKPRELGSLLESESELQCDHAVVVTFLYEHLSCQVRWNSIMSTKSYDLFSASDPILIVTPTRLRQK